MVNSKLNTINFWSTPFIKSISPKEKLFYYYLNTNKYKNKCGIFHLPKEVIINETGLDKIVMNKLLKTFIRNKKVLYNNSTEEILIIDWLKFNPILDNYDIELIYEELSKVKTQAFLCKFNEICKELKITYLDINKIFFNDCTLYEVDNL